MAITQSEIALRAYLPTKGRRKRVQTNPIPFRRVIALDVETTDDAFQNLKFGFYVIYEEGGVEYKNFGLFYNPEILLKEELEVLEKYAEKHDIPLLTATQFVDNIFYPEVYYKQTLCVGFNLPFDLSRLALSFNPARKEMFGGFALRLSKNKKFPPLRIRHVGSKLSFIGFSSGFDGSGNRYNFAGNFVDLHTLAFSLTDEDFSLKLACEHFDTDHKKLEGKHGRKLNPKYIDYNIGDVLATYDLFCKLRNEFSKYDLPLPLTKVYSPASIGKACLRKLGVTPFLELVPDYPKEMLGKIMTAYYGGRSEVKYRKRPFEVVLLDFLSMYPTVFSLQQLWRFVIAERIEVVEDTENIRKLVEGISLQDIQNPENWKLFTALVEIEPESDVLPVRSLYGNKDAYTIGSNFLTLKQPIPYTLADVIISKLLTGKTPKITRAWRFKPIGVQKSLVKTKIGDIEIDPAKDDFFKLLIEERQKIKEEIKNSKTSFEKAQLDGKQRFLKVVANSAVYGIFIEIISKNKKCLTEGYGLEKFIAEFSKTEQTGEFFNPIIAVFLTSAARLILATVEVILTGKGAVHGFCDTDSMAVPYEHYQEVQGFFKSLNKYSFDKPLFKIEKENFDSNGNFQPILLYGISAKRYVLYTFKDGRITILKHSSHGLGQLLNPFGETKAGWEAEIWRDILRLHYGQTTERDLYEKYSSLFALGKIAVTTPTILKRFVKMNNGQPLTKQIKPFNFILAGIGNKSIGKNGVVVKPITAYTKNHQSVVRRKFIDYNTGREMKSILYWKPMYELFNEYLRHPESKSEGDMGILQRKHVVATGIRYIGKESENIENVGVLDRPEYSNYENPEKKKQKILSLTTKQAKAIGIARNTLHYLKKRAKEGKNVRAYSKVSRKLKKL